MKGKGREKKKLPHSRKKTPKTFELLILEATVKERIPANSFEIQADKNL